MGGVDNLVSVGLSSLYNCAVQLPSSWANPLLNSNKKPQQLVFELNWNSESTGKPGTLFVSWSGLAATQKDKLVLDRGYAQAVGLTSSDRVSIRYVSQVPKARSIELVPSTVEDWEVLELNAGFLEDQFLNQCRVVAQGQVVTLWVKGQTRISLKVVNTQPPSSTCVMLQETSEIHVQPITRKKEAEAKSSEDTPTLPSRVLRLVAAVVLGTSPPLLFPNVMTIAVHPGSILSLSETSRLGLAFQDYPTLVTLSSLTRDFDEKHSSNRASNLANNSNSNSNPSSKNPEETSQTHALPRAPQIVVTVIWSSTVPIGVVLAPSLLVSTLLTPFRFISRVQLSFQLPTLVQTRQLRVRPFFPASPVTSSRKKRVDSSPVNGQENQTSFQTSFQTGLFGGTSVGSNSLSRSWITQAISTWFKNQEDSPTNMAITQGMLLTLPENLPVPLTISVDLGVPAGSGLAYSIVSADEWARISIVESEPAQFVSPGLLAQERQTDPTPSAPQLGAVEETLNRAFSTLRTGLGLGVAKSALGVAPNVGVLICGARGSGKTSVLKVLQNRLQSDLTTLAMCHSVDCGDWINERVAVVFDQLEEALFAAAWCSPGVVVLDNLDSLLPAEMEHMDSFRFRQLAECFAGLIKRLRGQYPGVALLATATQSQSLHPLLLASHTFTTTLHLSPPGKLQRQKILEAIMETSSISPVRSSLPLIDLSEISGSTEGYLPADLKTLIERATHQAAIRQLHSPSDSYEPDAHRLESEQTELVLSTKDFLTAQEGYTPVSLRGVKLQVSTVRWSDVGGLEETRKVLRETLEWPIKYQAIFQSCPLRLRSGLMLYGYPGCGKTMLASAVARECQLNFITVKGPEILNKYIGASEQSVRDLFQRAQAARPCVLFFDEFEAIAPRRGHDSTGVTDRVVNQLLTQMDGAEGLEGVYVLAATSRPDLIDPALLRPGRLDKSLLCHLPTATDRLAILSAHASKFHFADGVVNRFVEVAAQCQNFSGADLQALLYNAHLEAIHQTLDSKPLGGSSEEETSNSHQIPFKIINLPHKKLDSKRLPALTLAEKDKVNARLDIIRRHYNTNSNIGLEKSKSTADHPKHITSITWDHITKALESTNPSLPSSEISRLNAIYDEFQFGKGGGDKSKLGKKSTLG